MRRRRVRGIAARVIVLIALSRPALALDPARALTQYMRENWQTEQGLPQNAVGAIQRTRDGYLWVGTEEGLARFDGVRFVVFNRHSTAAFAGDSVNTLHEDSRGRLWVGTSRGLLVRERGVFRRVGPTDLRIATLLEDGRGIWVGTLGAGLMRLEWTDETPRPVRGSFGGKRIRAIARDGVTLWLATENGLVALQNGSVRELHVSDGLLNDNLFALWRDLDGTLWIGSDGGLQSLRGGRLRTFAPPLPDAISLVRALWRDPQGSLWVGTQGNGVGRVRGERVEMMQGAALASNVINAIGGDVEGNLWLGTAGGGLMRLRDGKVATFGTDEGLAAPTVFSLLQAKDGAMWFGLRGGGAMRLRDGALESWSTKRGLPSDDVVSLAETGDGTMWVGTYGGGLVAIHDGRLIARITAVDGLGSDAVYALLPSRDGSLWVGTGGTGLRRIRGTKVESVAGAEPMASAFVQTLLEDRRDGSLWAGTNDGLAHLHDGRMQSWSSGQGLPDRSVISLAQSTDGSLWIGTAGGGVARFRDGRFAVIDVRRGLHDDMVAAIVDDGRGRFWFSSNHGLFSVAKDSLDAVADGKRARVESDVYGAADGMRSAECYGGSFPVAARDSAGRLWFATIRGAAVVDPRRLPANAFAPPVVIESMVADGAIVRTGARLAAGTRRVEIGYSGLALRDPERVRFRTMLEGFDRAWTDAGTRRTTTYTNLPHGRFRFLVLARNENGVWSRAAAESTFEVLPAVWETWWFRMLAALTLVAFGILVHRLRVWRLKARQRELEQLVDVRTHQLAEANRELDRLARVDGLTGIANRRAFDEALHHAWAEERRNGGSLAVILCDIDQFKKFNDSQGHQAGDATLRSVAQAVAASLRRETDLVARYGGEELVLLLPDTDLEAAIQLAESVLENVRALAIPHPASEVAPYVTLSLGIAAMDGSEEGDAATVVLRADEALYQAKTTGRNRCVAA